MNNAASRRLSTHALGLEGELSAAAVLERKGMRIIARNIRSPWGEIDLAALDGDVLTFVEVKNWPAYGLENLNRGINEKKKRRIIETAKYFLSMHREYNYRSVRFDVVFLKNGESVHLDSAFTESP
ncbi:MAG: YraN family protein [Spirochaetaceae bacterium]|nr:YraN family protein [Spirochaetaceae bacterium]